jgi:hypothetical protein
MVEARRILVQGAICGGFVAAGLMFLIFWHIVRSSPNAGAMVRGQFQPYQDEPSWHLMAAGGLILLAAGLGLLAWAWRQLGKPR